MHDRSTADFPKSGELRFFYVCNGPVSPPLIEDAGLGQTSHLRRVATRGLGFFSFNRA